MFEHKKPEETISASIIKYALPITLLVASCSSPPAAKNTASVRPPSGLQPQAIQVEKPVNVSFSTYSKDWPVDWQWIDPDEQNDPTPHDVRSGVLRIRIPSKKDLYGNNKNAPRYLKAIKGDFQIETRVRFAPKENYQGAGILIFKDEDNYLRFERSYGGIGGGGEGIRFDANFGGRYRPVVTPGEIQTEAAEVDLKMIRSGSVFLAYWRESEDGEWREAGEFETNYPDTILAGVLGVNTAREVTAEFVYIRLLPGLNR
jgi:beta-xylosidase